MYQVLRSPSDLKKHAHGNIGAPQNIWLFRRCPWKPQVMQLTPALNVQFAAGGRNVVRVDGESTMEEFLTKFQAGQALRKVAFAEVRSAKPQKQFFFREKRFPAFNIAFTLESNQAHHCRTGPPLQNACLAFATEHKRHGSPHIINPSAFREDVPMFTAKLSGSTRIYSLLWLTSSPQCPHYSPWGPSAPLNEFSGLLMIIKRLQWFNSHTKVLG
jgi:hypothetical protein